MPQRTQNFLIDIETTGTYCPAFAMIQIGAVHAENPENTFFGTLKPLANQGISKEAMDYTGIKEAELATYDDASTTMARFLAWVKISCNGARPIFISDTTAFDHSFVSWYLWEFTGENPFGHSPRSLNAIMQGLSGGEERSINKLRKTKHDHNALNDAIGNYEAWVIVQEYMRKRRIAWKKGQD